MKVQETRTVTVDLSQEEFKKIEECQQIIMCIVSYMEDYDCTILDCEWDSFNKEKLIRMAQELEDLKYPKEIF